MPPALLLTGIVLFLAGVNTGVAQGVLCAIDGGCEAAAPPDALASAPAGGAGSPDDQHVGPAVPALEAERVTARTLPIHVDVTNSQDLREWARSDGMDVLARASPLNPWERIMLGRFLAIDALVARYADHFGNDPLWMTLVLSAESALDPLAQGPQVDDRGLGQVGFASEETGRRWVADRSGPYYLPEFDSTASIWSPRENIIIAAIVLRSLYAMPDVATHEQAYARYTHGLAALRDGRIDPASMTRVERARSYEEMMRTFFVLAYSGPSAGADVPLLADPLVRGMLLLDRVVDDGIPMYLALRDLYVKAAERERSHWGFVLNLQEALIYTRLAQQVSGLEGDEQVREIRELLEQRRPAIESIRDPHLTATLRSALAAADRTIPGR